MSTPKIITVIGARPQFIKAAMVSPQLATFAEEIIIHTGQHFDTNMSDVFFEELNIPEPKYNLEVRGGSHGDMTGNMLISIEEVLQKEKPDLVIVHGDTNSTLAGALAAVKLHIPVAHIEAGARSFDREAPEEINRLVTDQIASLHFAVSQSNVQNLLHEGCSEDTIFHVGDVMYDLALSTKRSAIDTSANLEQDFVLVTLHRANNVDNLERLKLLVNSFHTLSHSHPLVWLMHPRTKKTMDEANITPHNDNITIKDPQSYLQMMQLLSQSKIVVTDSGGLQKEAFYFEKPCITVRQETEWTELCESGWNKIVFHQNEEEFVKESVEFIEKDFSSLPHPALYGNGDAAKQIAQIIQSYLNSN